MTSTHHTWHTLTPSRSETETWIASLYETVATHRELMDAHTVDFFISSHWDNVTPERWKDDMESSGALSDSVLFQTSPSDDHGSLGHFLYTVQSRSIPIVWGQNSVSIPDHLVRFGMTTKKSHEVDNLSNYISLFTSQLNTHQILDVGSGKGYLSQHLALCKGLCVVGVDAKPSNTHGARSRNKKVYKAWSSTVQPHKTSSNKQAPSSTTEDQSSLLGDDTTSGHLDLSSLFDSRLSSSTDDSHDAESEKTTNYYREKSVQISRNRDHEPRSDASAAHENVSKNGENVESFEHSPQSRRETGGDFIPHTDPLSYVPLTQTISDASITSSASRENCSFDESIMAEAERESRGRFVVEANTCLVGLHTCGDLGGMALRLFLRQPQLRAACVVGCCYHHITETAGLENLLINVFGFSECLESVGFPLSGFLKSRGAFVGRTGRMLACQAACRVSLVSSGAALESIFRRAVLQVILQRNYPDVYEQRGKALVVGRMHRPPQSFSEYVQQALRRLGLEPSRVSSDAVDATYCEFESKKEHLSTLLKLRAVLASAVESLILLDRVLFMQEQENVRDVRLVQLFDPSLSPRCFAVVATKK